SEGRQAAAADRPLACLLHRRGHPRSRPAEEPDAMTTTVVSGGTGYVGRSIVEGLLKSGHQVVVLGRTTPAKGFFSAPVTFAPLDLDSGKVDPDLFASASFFVHAAFDHVPGRYRGGEGDDPETFRRRNMDGSLALFEAAKAAGARRTVFLS